MNTETSQLSNGFQRLYCDAAVFDGFSGLHPISFRRVLPFQSQDPVADDPRLIEAEEAHLANRNDDTRWDVVDAYFISAFDPPHAEQTTPRLKAAMHAFAPFHEIYVDWVSHDTPAPAIQPEGYPFRVELDGGSLARHKMNQLFATCGQADALIARGCTAEAKRLLFEAAILEPEADFVRERIKALP